MPSSRERQEGSWADTSGVRRGPSSVTVKGFAKKLFQSTKGDRELPELNDTAQSTQMSFQPEDDLTVKREVTSVVGVEPSDRSRSSIGSILNASAAKHDWPVTEEPTGKVQQIPGGVQQLVKPEGQKGKGSQPGGGGVRQKKKTETAERRKKRGGQNRQDTTRRLGLVEKMGAHLKPMACKLQQHECQGCNEFMYKTSTILRILLATVPLPVADMVVQGLEGKAGSLINILNKCTGDPHVSQSWGGAPNPGRGKQESTSPLKSKRQDQKAKTKVNKGHTEKTKNANSKTLDKEKDHKVKNVKDQPADKGRTTAAKSASNMVLEKEPVAPGMVTKLMSNCFYSAGQKIKVWFSYAKKSPTLLGHVESGQVAIQSITPGGEIVLRVEKEFFIGDLLEEKVDKDTASKSKLWAAVTKVVEKKKAERKKKTAEIAE